MYQLFFLSDHIVAEEGLQGLREGESWLLVESLYSLSRLWPNKGDKHHTRLVQKYGAADQSDPAHPVFNEKELQLCCLLKADFSTKEINMLTRQSLQTIYQRKTQVRQKLSLAEAEDITKILG